jgi:hypothetical protein
VVAVLVEQLLALVGMALQVEILFLQRSHLLAAAVGVELLATD